jgi:hypothetical protein
MHSPRFLLLLALALCVCLASCSPSDTGKAPKAKPGTPAYFWAQAETTYAAGDFTGAAANLEKLTTRDGEYRQRAQIWLMALHAGIAKGDMRWADALEKGRKFSRTGEATFRREMAAARSAASQSVMSYLELANQYLGGEIPEQPEIAFAAAPAAGQPTELARIEKGILPPVAEMELARNRLRAQAISETTKAVAPEAGPGDRNKLFAAMASEMIDLCELYSSKRLNETGRVRMLTQVAGVAVEKMTPCDVSKALRKKIDGLNKKAGKPVS